MRFIFSIFLLSLMMLGGSVKAEEHDELVIGISQYPGTFHPNIDSMLARTYINAMARRDFTLYNADWELECMICTELPSFENGRAEIETHDDGTEGIAATYTMREGLFWGDGVAMTTADVVFTWEIMGDERTGGSNLELFKNDILDITVIDDLNFTVHFDKVACDFAGINDFNILPMHLERKIWESEPETYRRRTLYQQDTTNRGLWNGPYVIADIEQGSTVILEKNEYWWGDAPHFERIIIRVIENSSALTANLLAGDIDMIAGELGVTLDQALAFERGAFERGYGDEFEIIYKSGLIYEHIDLNLENPMLYDVRMRRALLYGINREALAAQLFAGRQPVAHSNISALDSIFDDDIRHYDYDPVRAAQLLDELGWGVTSTGMRVDAEANRLVLDFTTTAGNRTRELVQQFLVEQWRQIGIEVRVANQPARVLFGQTMTQREFSGMAMYAWMAAPQNIPRSTLHSEEIPTAANGWSGQNYPAYRNEEIDEVLEDLEVVCEGEANRALWSELQRVYAEDLPALPLFWRAEAYIFPEWLVGVEPTGHMYPTSFWVEDWGVE